MIKLTHHEMPVNKTLHHRTIEILTVLTLLIGSPSFLIYFTRSTVYICRG